MPPPGLPISNQLQSRTIEEEEEISEEISEDVRKALMELHAADARNFITPPRRSERIASSPRKTYTPTKQTTPSKRNEYSEQDPSAPFPKKPWPVTAHCKKKHPGLGCAAKDAHHAFDYYDPTDEKARPLKV